MKTIVIWSRKGGVGKTATAHALGAALMQRNKRVLFVDCDGQSNLSLSLAADEEAVSMYEVLAENEPIKKAIQTTPGGKICGATESLLDSIKAAPDRLKSELAKVSKDFDYCIVDTPAALGIITINCLVAADKVIIPVETDLFSIQGIPRILETLEEIRQSYDTKAKIGGFLVTRYSNRSNINKMNLESLKAIAKVQHTKVYKTPIRECIAVKEAKQMQQSIFEYAPKSNAAVDYNGFVEEFLNDK